MSQKAMPAWMNKPASAASEADQKAFVELSKDVTKLPVVKAALEQDSAWALATDGLVSWDVVTECAGSHRVCRPHT